MRRGEEAAGSVAPWVAREGGERPTRATGQVSGDSASVATTDISRRSPSFALIMTAGVRPPRDMLRDNDPEVLQPGGRPLHFARREQGRMRKERGCRFRSPHGLMRESIMHQCRERQ